MTIRQAIAILIDAPDKDKELLVEVNKDTIDRSEYQWTQVGVEQIVNCTFGSVIEGKEN